MKPLISVILPIYNMELYLERCLDSILGSSYHNLEIICVDDGSKDGSLEILRRYEAADPRVIVIAKENGGVSSARNAGLDRMTGAFVSFIDPDDFIHPRYFELLFRALTEANADISICGFRRVEDKDLPLPTDLEEDAGAAAETLDCVQLFKNHDYRSLCWGRLFRAALLRGLRFDEGLNYSEDSAFFASVGEHNPQMTTAVIPNKLYYYYQRENSLAWQTDVPGRFKAAKLFADKVLQSPENSAVYLDQAVKRCLSTRYLAGHILPDREIARDCGRLLKACRKRFGKTTVYSAKEKMIYSTFIRFPGAYWLYRSITEPDMWAWEKAERKKRREAEKNNTPNQV
ncbi:MAG: glycosyltransferase family 2 protein [Ruminococcaceae bacterium]|jgi:glycosyltransferase involved in cell wall biosynthesis|nr:glycosyltransferase family 2 protein [Oscillospiraceae bacterium]